MKTTIELPDALYHRAKAVAALNGLKLKDLVEEGLRLVLETPRRGRRGRRQRSLAELMAPAHGMIESGVPDLGSSLRHLKRLGRNGRNR